MSLNKVTLQGSIPTKENFKFELRNADNEDKAVLEFLLSVRQNYKKAGAEYADSDLIPVKLFGKKAINFYKMFKKGDAVLVEGEITRSKYNDVYSTDIIVRDFYFVEGAVKAKSSSDASAETSAPAASEAPKKAPLKPAGGLSLPNLKTRTA